MAIFKRLKVTAEELASYRYVREIDRDFIELPGFGVVTDARLRDGDVVRITTYDERNNLVADVYVNPKHKLTLLVQEIEDDIAAPPREGR